MAKTVLNKLLALAVQNEASDIHLKVDGPAVFRVGNDLVDTSYIPDAAALQQFFEQITQEEHRQKFHDVGDVDVSLLEEDVGRFRVNLHRQRGTIAVNLRHVKNTVRSFEDLGLPNTLGRIAETPRGIIFVTGTTGSGKSTTLAAMMEYMNQRFRRHIHWLFGKGGRWRRQVVCGAAKRVVERDGEEVGAGKADDLHHLAALRERLALG